MLMGFPPKASTNSSIGLLSGTPQIMQRNPSSGFFGCTSSINPVMVVLYNRRIYIFLCSL